MTRTAFTFTLAALLASGCGPSQAEMDNLKRRVSTLERRVRTLEGGAPARKHAKRKGGKHKGKRKNGGGKEVPESASVDVSGEALQVFISDGRKQHPIPGTVPVGEYEILATFEEGKAPIVAGNVVLKSTVKVRVDCKAAALKCTPEYL